MNKTAQLVKALQKIAEAHQNEVTALPKQGPKGGTNARHIPGWTAPGISALTRAAKQAGIPTLPYWSGSNPTPATALPSCLAKEAIQAYKKIFNKEQ